MSIWIVPTLEEEDDEIEAMTRELDLYGSCTLESLDVLDRITEQAGLTLFSSFVDASLIMCDEEGDTLEDYEGGDFTDGKLVLQSVRLTLDELEKMPDASFLENCKQHILENWRPLIPLLEKTASKNLRLLFQLG